MFLEANEEDISRKQRPRRRRRAAPPARLLRLNRARGSKFPSSPRSIKYLVTTIIDETAADRDRLTPQKFFWSQCDVSLSLSPSLPLSFRLPCMTMIKHDKWIDPRHEAHFA